MMSHVTHRRPTLTWDIAELVLVHAVRSVDTLYPTSDAAALIHALIVAAPPPDTSISTTDVTRAALAQLWWITTDWASQRGNVHLLNLLFTQRHWRPLVYAARRGLRAAVERGHLAVLRWWYTQRAHGHMWFADVQQQWMLTLLDSTNIDRAAVRKVLEWFFHEHDGQTHPQHHRLLQHAVLSACKAADLALLDYLLGASIFGLDFSARHHWTWKAIGLAAESGQMPILEWLLCRLAPAAPGEACSERLMQHLIHGCFASGSLNMVRWLQETALVFPFTGGQQLQADMPSDGCNYAINGASVGGHLHLVQWAIEEQLDRKTGKMPQYSPVIVDLDQVVKEMRPGFVSVLEWWTTAGNATRFGIQVTGTMAAWAVHGPLLHGSVEFVTWWFAQPSHFHENTSVEMVAAAAEGGNVHLLDLLYKANQFKRHFNEPEIVTILTEHGHIGALEWWQATVTSPSLLCIFQPMSLARAGSNGHVSVLTWWSKAFERAGRPMPLALPDILLLPSAAGQILVLEWWRAHHPATIAQVDRLWQDMSPNVTKWWARHGAAVPNMDKSWFLHAALAGNPILLAFVFGPNGVGVPRDAANVDRVVRTACVHGHAHVLDWLARHSGLPFTFGVAAVFLAVVAPLVDASWNVIEWWVGRVKAGDTRCKVDMGELERKVTLVPKGVAVWPRLKASIPRG